MSDAGPAVEGYEDYVDDSESGSSERALQVPAAPAGSDGSPDADMAAPGPNPAVPTDLPALCSSIGQVADNGFTTLRTNPCDTVEVDSARMGDQRLEIDPDNPDEPEPDRPDQQPVVLTASDFQSLPIDPGTLTIQPGRDWVLVNKETIAFTDAIEQTLTTQILGTPVTVHVIPVDYTWNYDDGTVFTTSDPGASWPDHTVSHTYRQAGTTHQITLTTRWIGEYQINHQGPWLPVDGIATTTRTSHTFEVREYDTHLTAPGT